MAEKQTNKEAEKILADAEEVPSPLEAMEDPGAADARQAHAQRVEKLALKEHAVPGTGKAPGSPSEKDRPGIPHEVRKARLKPLPSAAALANPKADVEELPVETDASLLRAIQDPYNERNPGAVPMVYTKDAYGNVVPMPVVWLGALLLVGSILPRLLS